MDKSIHATLQGCIEETQACPFYIALHGTGFTPFIGCPSRIGSRHSLGAVGKNAVVMVSVNCVPVERGEIPTHAVSADIYHVLSFARRT